jgi:hypothetical protein
MENVVSSWIIYLKAMRYIILLFGFFIALQSSGQNLVPNPSFEAYDPCGTDTNCKNLTPQSNQPCYSTCCAHGLPQQPDYILGGTKNWWAVSRINNVFDINNPVYISSCVINTWIENQAHLGNRVTAGWYLPHTGNAYIFMRTYGSWDIVNQPDTDTRDYAQVKLSQPLRAGCTYEASCYILNRPGYVDDFFWSIHSQGKQQGDGFGFYFSVDSVYRNDDVIQRYKAMTDIIPQVSNPAGYLLTDSVNYHRVSGIFTAQGGEQWLVLGNFKDNAHTQALYSNLEIALYAIDDVSVTEWKPDLVAFTDTSLCVDSSLTVMLPDGLKDYKWSTGETTKQIHIAGGSGRYTVEASNGCTILRDTFYIHAVQRFSAPFTLGADTFFCRIPVSYQLHAPEGFDMYEWSNGSHASNMQLSNAGTYWLNASYACGTLTDTIVITEFVQPDSLLIPTHDTTICSNSSIDLLINHASSYSTFIWNDGSSQNHLVVNQAKQYSVKAYTLEGCEVRDTIHITTIVPPVFSLQRDTLVCEGSELKLVVSKKINEQLVWNDGSVDSSYRIHSSGIYWAKLSNTCFNTTDSITVTFLDCTVHIPNLITVNGDHMNDYFVIQTEINRTFELSIYTSWGSQIYHDAAYQNSWNAEGLDSGIYFYYINDPLLKKNYKGWLQVIK